MDNQWAVMPSMSHPVSASIIGRRLLDAGLYAHRLLWWLPLTPCQHHYRLQRCPTWSDIFSDGSCFCLGGGNQRIWVWRHCGQHHEERSVITRPIFPFKQMIQEGRGNARSKATRSHVICQQGPETLQTSPGYRASEMDWCTMEMCWVVWRVSLLD